MRHGSVDSIVHLCAARPEGGEHERGDKPGVHPASRGPSRTGDVQPRGVQAQGIRLANDEMQGGADMRHDLAQGRFRRERVIYIGDCKSGAQHARTELRMLVLGRGLPIAAVDKNPDGRARQACRAIKIERFVAMSAVGDIKRTMLRPRRIALARPLRKHRTHVGHLSTRAHLHRKLNAAVAAEHRLL